VSEHPNATLIRRMNDAMMSGDMSAAAGFLADDVEWHEIGRDEPIRGLAALAERYQGAEPPDWQITNVEVHDVVANDEHAIGLGTNTATRGGRTFTYRTAEIYHVKDGKVTARWAFSDDTAAINEFFA